MKRILLSIFALLLLLSSNILHAQYTQGDVDAAKTNLLDLSGGDVFQERIDTILWDISPEKKSTFLEKLPKVQKQYSSKAIITVKDKYIIAIIDYILVELWVQDGWQIISSDTTVSISPTPEVYNENTCDDFTSVMQFQNGLSNDGNIIPNRCDPSIPDWIYSEYYETGGAKFEIPVRNGRYDGVAQWYYEDGVLQSKWEYNYGVVTWEYDFYDRLWTLTQKNIYNQDSSVQVIQYYTNGQISSISNYKDNQENGEYQSFYTNGAKSYYYDMQWSIPQQDFKKWYKNGELQTHISVNDVVLVDKPNLQIQNWDFVVMTFFIYDNETSEIIAGNYGIFEESEILSSNPIYSQMIGMEEFERKEFILLGQEAYPEIESTHPWYNKTLRFDMFTYGIRR